MASWHGVWRSNYFEVENPEAFINELLHHDISYQRVEDKFVLLGDDGDGFPTIDDDEGNYIDFVDWLGPFLAKDSICILMEAGAEKLRYISGYAWALRNPNHHPDAHMIDVRLSIIYQLAATTFGVERDSISFAEY